MPVFHLIGHFDLGKGTGDPVDCVLKRRVDRLPFCIGEAVFGFPNFVADGL